MIKELKKENIVDNIQDIILKLYPIVDNRSEVLFAHSREQLDIDLYFYSDEKIGDITQVMFCKGNNSRRTSIDDILNIENLITEEEIINLIKFILSYYDYIKNFYINNDTIYLSFGVDLSNAEKSGISCHTIDLTLDFSRYKEKDNIMYPILKRIIETFYEQLKNTETYKKEYSKYCDKLKIDFIEEVSTNDLELFMSLLTNEDFKQIIKLLPNERFIELLNEFYQRKDVNTLSLIKPSNFDY